MSKLHAKFVSNERFTNTNAMDLSGGDMARHDTSRDIFNVNFPTPVVAFEIFRQMENSLTD